ncbi:hypothetical protein HDU83_006133 [Entophlyctis luteolus]|nr:hypothetical protein HDU83_006133 [Entophlyctis luteolus]
MLSSGAPPPVPAAGQHSGIPACDQAVRMKRPASDRRCDGGNSASNFGDRDASDDDDDDELQLSNVLKRAKISCGIGIPAPSQTSHHPRSRTVRVKSDSTPTVQNSAFDSDDDEEVLPRKECESGPIQTENDASDYFASDAEDARTTSVASEERRRERRATTVQNMAKYFLHTMPAAISDVHDLYLRKVSSRELLFSSLNLNIIAKALTNAQPRRIHEVLDERTLTEKDAKILYKNSMKDPEESGSGSTSSASTPDRGVGFASAPAAFAGIANPDYILECKSTLLGVKEDRSSLYRLLFETKEDCSIFQLTFEQAVKNHASNLAEVRTSTYTTPQPMKRVLLSGQTVAIAGPTHLSPFAANPTLARQLAESGLAYIPSILPETVANAQAHNMQEGQGHSAAPAGVQHRLVCMHCHAALAVCTRTAALPSAAEVFAAHAGHPFARRRRGATAKERRSGAATADVYYCVYAAGALNAFGGVVVLNSEIQARSAEVGGVAATAGALPAHGGTRKGWDLVVVS